MVIPGITTGKILSFSNKEEYFYYFDIEKRYLEIAITPTLGGREYYVFPIMNNKISWGEAEKWIFNIPKDVRTKLDKELQKLILKIFW